MKSTLTAIALASSLVLPVLAVGAMSQSPTCEEFMAMDSTGQMQSMQSMHDSMAMDSTASSSGEMMSPDAMAANAMKACSAEPGSTVDEAMKMMEGNS